MDLYKLRKMINELTVENIDSFKDEALNMFPIAYEFDYEYLIGKYNLRGENRLRSIVDMRSYIYYILYNKGFSKTDIGKIFKKDHATVIHGLKHYDALYKTKEFKNNIHLLKEDVSELIKELKKVKL